MINGAFLSVPHWREAKQKNGCQGNAFFSFSWVLWPVSLTGSGVSGGRERSIEMPKGPEYLRG